ncbi:hypothetical protein SAMN05444422_111119 [Halobiforma haloterrestris]|uniref:Dolichyl-phosphate-mannose-protein mannosyltransferase n=1 Tax=Natronobacterium haloterrestre TaxID=148448 RepID=A0A1I1KGX7_NATHA|nr:hypothetical protein SAMN05444422_111119 [Halobiforma haloterrestris]
MFVDAPHGISGRRPATHATNWFFTELLGGGQGAADTVAAWLPVVASVALGLLIYKLAVLLTRDVRVGVASVLVFAVTPVNAVYTSLGFLDHNLHQYFWLGVTLCRWAGLQSIFSDGSQAATVDRYGMVFERTFEHPRRGSSPSASAFRSPPVRTPGAVRRYF